MANLGCLLSVAQLFTAILTRPETLCCSTSPALLLDGCQPVHQRKAGLRETRQSPELWVHYISAATQAHSTITGAFQVPKTALHEATTVCATEEII